MCRRSPCHSPQWTNLPLDDSRRAAPARALQVQRLSGQIEFASETVDTELERKVAAEDRVAGQVVVCVTFIKRVHVPSLSHCFSCS